MPTEGNSTRSEGKQLRHLMSQVRPYWRRFLLAMFFSVFASGLSLIQPVLVGNIISGLERSEQILYPIIILLILLSLSAVLTGLQHFALGTLGEQVTSRVRKRFVHSVLSLPIQQAEAYRRADLVTRATADTTLLRTALTQGIGQIIGGGIMFLGAIIAMGIISPLLLLASLAVVFVALLSIAAFSGPLRRTSTAVQESVSALGVTLDQHLHALKTIRSLNGTAWAVSRLEKAIEEARLMGIRFAKITAIITPVSGVVMQVALAVVFGLGAYQVATGTLEVAQLVSFVMYLFLLLAPVSQAVTAITSITQALAASKRLEEVGDFSQSRLAFLSPNEPPVTSPPGEENVPALDFENVTFGYPQGSSPCQGVPREILRNVSFSVVKGSTTGIVGLSGAGKSSVLHLISGFYQPTSGNIQVFGQTPGLKPFLPSPVGLVEQGAPVIAGTVRENLTLGDGKITEQACVAALQKVNLSHLSAQPLGLDHMLSDHGTNLSGGERQRLAIARALLAGLPILLLDESTSQVDSHNEELLRSAIENIGDQRTTLIVAHRLGTVIDSDAIIVLSEGEIEAIGTHSDLLKSSPTYLMFARQQNYKMG